MYARAMILDTQYKYEYIRTCYGREAEYASAHLLRLCIREMFFSISGEARYEIIK